MSTANLTNPNRSRGSDKKNRDSNLSVMFRDGKRILVEEELKTPVKANKNPKQIKSHSKIGSDKSKKSGIHLQLSLNLILKPWIRSRRMS